MISRGLLWIVASVAWTAQSDPDVTFLAMQRLALPPKPPQFTSAQAWAHPGDARTHPLRRRRWGTYRPGQYFGIKSRSEPLALNVGLAWHSSTRNSALRHDCRQEDGLGAYGFTEHDGEAYGEQLLQDETANMLLKTSFAATPSLEGDWVARVEATTVDTDTDAEGFEGYLYIYVSLDCDQGATTEEGQLRCPSIRSLEVKDKGDAGLEISGNFDSAVDVMDYHAGGDFEAERVNFVLDVSVKELTSSSVAVVRAKSLAGVTTSAAIPQLVEKLRSWDHQAREWQFPKNVSAIENGARNAIIMQVPYTGSVQIDLIMRTEESSIFTTSPAVLDDEESGNGACVLGSSNQECGAIDHGPLDVDAVLTQMKQMYQQKFDDYASRYADGVSDREKRVAQVALSNLLGGMGFFTGQSTLKSGRDGRQSGKQESTVWSFPSSLLSLTPSRSFFPRGFFWDEGFHLFVLNSFNQVLSLEILSHWFSLIHRPEGAECNDEQDSSGVEPYNFRALASQYADLEDQTHSYADVIYRSERGGWIPREQMLGESARSRVPDEFRDQEVGVANPPTLLLAIESLLNRLDAGNCAEENGPSCAEQAMIAEELVKMAPSVHAWFSWFVHSQKGILKGTYRWRGRSPDDSRLHPMTLASGIDDSVRSVYVGINELHADLGAWVAFGARVMTQYISFVQKFRSAEKSQRAEAFDLPVDDLAFLYTGLYNETKAGLARYHYRTIPEGSTGKRQGGVFDFGPHCSTEKCPIEDSVVIRCSATQAKDGRQRNRLKATDVAVPLSLVEKEMERSGGRPDYSRLCPPGYPHFMYPLKDSNGGAQVRQIQVSKLRNLDTELDLSKVPEQEHMQLQHVMEVSYITFLPLALQLYEPESDQLGQTLALLEDEEHLWSPYGLRSLSSKSKFYRVGNAPGDAPYWRGPIWININFLIVRALHHYGAREGPHQAQARLLYSRLRENVMKTVISNFDKTQFFYEQYDERNGKGDRTHPFTGWTATIVNIILEHFD